MKLHIYDASEHGKRFRPVVKAVAGFVARKNIVRHRYLAGLIKGLVWNEWYEPVIIFTESDDDLEQIMPHVGHFSNYRIVLVLHDDKLATLARGHKLRPRILFSQPVDEETIAAVIARIMADKRPPIFFLDKFWLSGIEYK